MRRIAFIFVLLIVAALAVSLLTRSSTASARIEFETQPNSPTIESSTTEPQQRRRQVQRPNARRRQTARRAVRPYNEYRHDIPAHINNCANCHTTNSLRNVAARDLINRLAVNEFPDHDACISCHRTQFFTGARPQICTVCHTVVSPRSGARFEFPKSNGEFSTVFPHDVHQYVLAKIEPAHKQIIAQPHFVNASFIAQDERPEARINKLNRTCAACHTADLNREHDAPAGWIELEKTDDKETQLPNGTIVLPDGTKRLTNGTTIAPDGKATEVLTLGTFQLSPAGDGAHATCFACHYQAQKPIATDCAGCHGLQNRRSIIKNANLTSNASRQSNTRAGKLNIAVAHTNDVRWTRRISAKFRHEDGNHNGISCTSCHTNILASDQLATIAARVPFATCAGCHVKQIRNEFAAVKKDVTYNCAYCHIPGDEGKRAIPASHTYGGAFGPIPRARQATNDTSNE